MNLTLNQVIAVHQALSALFTQKLPARAQFYVSRNLVKVEEELKGYNDTRYALGQKYGTHNKETSQFDFPDEEAFQAFADELTELNESEVDLDLTPLKLEWIESLDVEGPVMMVLMDTKLIKE